MSDFERILVGYNEYGFNSTIAEKTDIKNNIQQVFNNIIALNLGILFAAEDPTLLFEDPKAFFCSKLVTEPMLIGGLELDKAKVFELMIKPQGLTDLVNDLLNLKENGSNTAKDRFFFRYAGNFTISNNIVELKQNVIDEVTEMYSIYVETQKQKDIKDHLDSVILSLTSIKTLYPAFKFDSLIGRYLNANDSTNSIDINFRELKGMN